MRLRGVRLRGMFPLISGRGDLIIIVVGGGGPTYPAPPMHPFSTEEVGLRASLVAGILQMQSFPISQNSNLAPESIKGIGKGCHRTMCTLH